MTRSTHPTRTALAGAAIVTILAVSATGCGSDTDERSGDSGSAGTSASAGDGATTSRAGGSELDPDSPFVVAATAVAKRSRDQVLQVHAMTVAAVSGGFPAQQIPGVARGIRSELASQIQAATMATPPKGSAAARLVAALRDYSRLAGTLVGWRRGEDLPASFLDDLKAADRSWRSALRELGELSGEDLLADLPPLAMPR